MTDPRAILESPLQAGSTAGLGYYPTKKPHRKIGGDLLFYSREMTRCLALPGYPLTGTAIWVM
jgi:hypothetical protein